MLFDSRRRSRFLRVIGLFLKIFWSFYSLKFKRLWHSKSWLSARREALYAIEARRFRETAVDMGGMLIKLGQFFSTRVDVMPTAAIRELEGLQDEVQSVVFEQIRQVVEEQFHKPLEQVFASFEEKTEAAASLGQVHKAQLTSGQTVAVKIMRPEIDILVDIDLKALSQVIRFLKRFTHWGSIFDLDLIFQEFSESMWEELDYIHEGKNAETIASNSRDNNQLLIPKIYWDYTTHRVLTMEFMNGIKIGDYKELDRVGIDRRKLAKLLVSVYCDQILTDGFFHADPHPGNLFVTEDGRLIMVDFGMVGRISAELRQQLLDLAIAVIQQQYIQVADDLKEMGFLRPYADNQLIARTLSVLVERFFGEGQKLDDSAFMRLLNDIEQIVYEQPFQIPGNYTMLGRAAGTLYGLCFGIDPKVNFIEALQPYLNKFIGGKKGLFDTVKEQGTEFLRSAAAFPSLATRVLQQVEHGELSVHVPMNQLLEISSENARSAKMVPWAIVFGSLLFSSVYLLVHDLTIWAYGGFMLSLIAFLIMLAQKKPSKKMRHPSMVPRGR